MPPPEPSSSRWKPSWGQVVATLAIMLAVGLLVGGVVMASTGGFGVILGMPITLIGGTIGIPFVLFLARGGQRPFNTGLVFLSLTVMGGFRLFIGLSFSV